MLRTASSQRFAAEEAALTAFLAPISRMMVRRASIYQPALLPSGARLRGIRILPDLFLARDLQFYKLQPGAARAQLLTFAEALRWVRFGTIEKRVRVAFAKTGVVYPAAVPPIAMGQ